MTAMVSEALVIIYHKDGVHISDLPQPPADDTLTAGLFCIN
jgi:hypothetical protein